MTALRTSSAYAHTSWCMILHSGMRMWSPDVIKSEAAQEAEFGRVYTKYTADVRAELMAAGVPEQHALELAAGKRTRPISCAALRTTSIHYRGLVVQH
jgi:hypothetical protein